MKHCPRKNTPTGIGVNAAGGYAIVHKMGCKSWKCPYCSMKRKGWLVVKAYNGIENYKRQGAGAWFFGTLTMHRKTRGAKSIAAFKKNWNKFYQRMKRATNGNLYYVLLPEQHKDGSLHVHIISTCQTDTRWWKDNAAQCGMGFKSENKPLVSTAKACWYVTKYIGKTLELATWPDDLRRVRFSVRWPLPLPDDNFTWKIVPPDMARYVVRAVSRMGYKFVNTNTGAIVNVTSRATANRRQQSHTAFRRANRLLNSNLATRQKMLVAGLGFS